MTTNAISVKSGILVGTLNKIFAGQTAIRRSARHMQSFMRWAFLWMILKI